MRLIAGTSDIFGKLPPGLPGSRFAVDQEMFGLDGRKHKKKTPVKVVEDHDEVPDVPSSSFVPPKQGQGRRRLPGYSPDDDGGMFGYFGQEATAPPAAATTPPAAATTPPAAAGGGASAKTETNWIAIGIGVAVVAGIIALIMYNKKPATGGGMGNVGKGESKKARKFISKQTRKLVRAGLPRTRAVAAAYSMARQKHFKVSPKPH